ncbi:MAG: hypothetical protein O2V44_05330 [Candidatus Bathyarchaeota archaeon]|nr:hypothetical protein [Candidatus Bathyarchaeota archaeon]
MSGAKKEKDPLPLLTEEWLNKRFPHLSSGRIRVVEGLGDHWIRQKFDSVIVVACHADLEVGQIKHFYPFFSLRTSSTVDIRLTQCMHANARREVWV